MNIAVLKDKLSEINQKKNSPTNVAGETSITMHEENIVVCQRTHNHDF